MKRKLLIISFLFLFSGAVEAQNRKGTLKLRKGTDAHKLYVSFNNGVNLGNSQDYIKDLSAYIPEFKELSEEYNITIRKTIAINPSKLAELEALAVKNTGSGASVRKLSNIVELKIENPTNERLMALGQTLEKFSGVEYCSLMSAKPIPFPHDIEPATPSLLEYQNYITDYGVDMVYAWDLGLTGQGINIRDLEGSMNPLHEELNDRNVSFADNITIHPDIIDDETHGTGVFGILYADPGNYGITGLAHGANELVMYSVITVEAEYDVPFSISKCFEQSTEGDFVIYELQTDGYGELEDYGPSEYDLPVWDLTKAATDAGIIVVAAAGNGNQDLDSPIFDEYNSRGDSGAIIVGAGSPDEAHDRLWYSTYGERVDLQGWGLNVLTAGTGQAYIVNDDNNQTYTWFSGTSSATPIVASCAIVLQSYYHANTGEYLSGVELKEILKQTGKPQGLALEGNIGPLPNMPQAIEAMDVLLGINSIEKNTFIAYPNPVAERLTITGNFSESVSAEVYNALGQLMYETKGIENGIDFSSFSKGVYIVKVKDNGKTQSRKVIKN
ncbi:S8 family peptidase [Flavobacterium suzhouense]|uniref:S8 family peptidase n=1 Tax=Flavobacterium suzhouense TaxID=1529638 RepID=A0ABW5NTJ0_9FLAO